jgi:hypothetical protein
MENTRFIIILILIILTIFIRIFLSAYIRYKKHGIKVVKNDLKIFIITFVCGIIIISISTIIYNFLPKYETEIEINILNNNEIIELNINGDFYIIHENEKNICINKKTGFIGIKTQNNNKIVYFTNDESIFKFNKKINIKIDNKEIKVNSFYVKITKFIENQKYYDNILELINKR